MKPFTENQVMNYNLQKTFLATALSLAIAPAVYATNGMAPTGLGQVHEAMGGAAVGNPQNTTTLMTNPAAGSFIDDGFDVGLEIFIPDRSAKSNFDPSLPPFSGNGKKNFLIPEAAYKKSVGKYALGISMYGNGGMNTKYKDSPKFPTPNGPFPMNGGAASATGINLEQLFIAPTISTKLNDKHSVGLAVNLVMQKFKAQGIGAFQGDPRANPNELKAFTNPGSSTATGIGAQIGWMGKLNDKFTVGASYRFKTKMSAFKKYKGLFADHGKLDVPAALTIGASAQISSRTTVAFDVQKIYYSDVTAIGNGFDARGRFGDKDGPGFGWDDQTVYKLGIKTQATPKLAVMAGYNHGKAPLDSKDTFFNVLAPATVEDHLSLGFEYSLSKDSSIIGSYTHTFKNTIKGDLLNAHQPFDLTMEQDAAGIAYSKRF